MTKPTLEEVKAFGKIEFFDTYYEPLVRYGGDCEKTLRV